MSSNYLSEISAYTLTCSVGIRQVMVRQLRELDSLNRTNKTFLPRQCLEENALEDAVNMDCCEKTFWFLFHAARALIWHKEDVFYALP